MQPRGVQRAPSSFFFALRRPALLLPPAAAHQSRATGGTFPALQLYANRNRGGRKAGTEPSACSCLGAWRATGGRPWTVQDRTLRRTLKGERRHSAYIHTAHSESGETDRRGAEIHTPRLRALPGHACGTLPPARLARVAPSDHVDDHAGSTRHSCGRSNLRPARRYEARRPADRCALTRARPRDSSNLSICIRPVTVRVTRRVYRVGYLAANSRNR